MKPICRIIALLALVCSTISAKAQVHLRVDTILNFPDTAIEGQTYFPVTIVQNVGQTGFTGTLSIGFQTQNPTGNIGLLYFSSLPISIAPNDTVALIPNNGFVFDTLFFRPGNNVVVVWPIASAAIIDTFYTDVYLQTISGLTPPLSNSLLLSPVPALEYLQVRARSGMQIEYVRIYDLAGREYPCSGQPIEGGGMELYLGNLPSGQYILETVFRNAPPARSRFLRVK